MKPGKQTGLLFFTIGNVAFKKNLVKSSGPDENEFKISTLNEDYGKRNIDLFKPLI